MIPEDPFRLESHFPPVHTGRDAETRLGALGGLTVDVIHRAASVGDQGRREVSRMHRSNYRGTRMQAEMFGDLGEQLAKRGWTKPRRKHDILERLHAPSGTFALTVNSGTPDVGEPDGTPSTRHPRGGAGKAAIDTNQGLLFYMPADKPQRDHVLTWFVLFYVDEHDEGRIKLEVSLPEIRTGGRITKWRERIILPTLEPPAGRGANESSPTPDVPDVDVPVLRRAK